MQRRWATSASGAHYGLKSDMALGPKCASYRLMRRSKWRFYSIASSARPSSESGTLMPSDLVVVRLMTRSSLVDCTTGRSAGFSPLRIR